MTSPPCLNSPISAHRKTQSTPQALILSPESIKQPIHSNPSPPADNQLPIRRITSPPLSNVGVPRGPLSPPDSPSSDEESSLHRHDPHPRLDQLQSAVGSIGYNGPPESTEPNMSVPRSEPRRVIRPRSSTEGCVAQIAQDTACDSALTSDHEDDHNHPPMIRKKSGELVRPALRSGSGKRRPSSAPGTPHFATKAVHFDSHLEHVRHFLRIDKPVAVSAENSPADEYRSSYGFPFFDSHHVFNEQPSMQWELRLPNFPLDPISRCHQPVRLERMHLSSDKSTLVGVVAVANISFEKLVVARFTFDNWKTVSEVAADYNADVRRKQAHDGYDRFIFSIKLSDHTNLQDKSLYVCIRYNVNGQEYWDNNFSTNYRADFVQVPRGHTHDGQLPLPLPTSSRSGTSPSRDSGGTSLLSSLFKDDSFSRFDEYMTSRRKVELEYENESIRPLEKPSSSSSAPTPKVDDPISNTTIPKYPQREQTTRQPKPPFGNRYDFGASLSAAMRTKPSEDRTTLTAKARYEDSSSKSSPPPTAAVFDTEQHERGRSRVPVAAGGFRVDTALPTTSVNRQEAHAQGRTNTNTNSGSSDKPQLLSFVSGKPHLDSSVYKELVEKYCFVCILYMNHPCVSAN